MNRSQTIRHNAKILRAAVRGKSEAERQAIYRIVAGGPLGLMAHIATSLVEAQQRVEIETGSFTADHERIVQEIERGARRSMHNERRFRL